MQGPYLVVVVLRYNVCCVCCRPVLNARYGSARQGMTIAIQKLLQQGDPEMVGVFAQLGYVDEPRLSAVLAANYCAAMQVGRANFAARMLPGS